MAKSKRKIVILECTGCKERNYTTGKNPQETKEKLELKKYCPRCRKAVLHKEIK